MLHTTQKRLDLLYITVVVSLLSIFAHMETERRGKEVTAYNPKNDIVNPFTLPETKEKHDSVSSQPHVQANKSVIAGNSSVYNSPGKKRYSNENKQQN